MNNLKYKFVQNPSRESGSMHISKIKEGSFGNHGFVGTKQQASNSQSHKQGMVQRQSLKGNNRSSNQGHLGSSGLNPIFNGASGPDLVS